MSIKPVLQSSSSSSSSSSLLLSEIKTGGISFLADLARRSTGVSITSNSSTSFSHNKLNDLRLGLRGISNTSQGYFTHYNNHELIKNRIFDLPNKDTFLDPNGLFWCHLCREPLGVSPAIHLSDREHHNNQLFLFIASAFPRNTEGELSRSYNPEFVLNDAERELPKLSKSIKNGYIHTEQDAFRRALLESMLIHLSNNNNNNNNNNKRPILTVFHGEINPEFAHSGERLFKTEVSRLIVEWFPALAPGALTQIAHKCWGRSNLESVYDVLRLQLIVNQRLKEPLDYLSNEGKIKGGGNASLHNKNLAWKAMLKRKLLTKTEKATFVRQLLWELTTRNEEAIEINNNSDNNKESLSFSELDCLILQLTRRQLAFEMVYLQSMKYMQHADHIFQEMSFPSLENLISMGIA